MNEPILHFTDNAINHIQKVLTQYPNGGGFRLSVKKTGCSGYKYLPEITAAPHAGDLQWTTEQGIAIYVDPAYVKMIKGTVVDFVDKGLGQQQLMFKNPNISGECGCGESFHIAEDSHE